jgi:hypothetical protein
MPLIFMPGIFEFSFISPFLGHIPKIMAYFSGIVALPYSAGMLAGLLIIIPEWFSQFPAYKEIMKLPSPP